MATGAGPSQRGVPSPRAIRRAPTPSRRACATPSTSASRELTVYSFSTENWSRPHEEVDALMAMFSRADPRRDARAARGGRADALHRPPRGRRCRELLEQMALGGGEDRRQRRASRCSWPSTTAGGRRSSTRRERSPAASEEEFRAAALRARDARPGPDHPHRAASSGSRTTCCGSPPTRSCTSPTCCGRTSRARTSRPRSPSTTRAGAASGAADGEPPRAAAATRRAPRARGSDLVARILVAIPAIAFAVVIIYCGRLGVRARGRSRSASSACTSCS